MLWVAARVHSKLLPPFILHQTLFHQSCCRQATLPTFSYIRWSRIPYLSPGSERLCHATAAARRLPVRQRTVVTPQWLVWRHPGLPGHRQAPAPGPARTPRVSFEASFYSVPDRLVRPGQRVRLAVHQGTITICALGTDADGWPPTTAPLEFHRLAW